MVPDIHGLERRIAQVEGSLEKRSELLRIVVQAAVREAMPSSLLSEEQYRWVELAIQKEAQSIAFRKAVIEKTTLGLIWSGIIGLGLIFKEFLVAHGIKF